MPQELPLMIGVCADVVQSGAHQYHQVGDKYIRALTDNPNVMAILLPAHFNELSDSIADAFMQQLDGVLLTGSYSNLQPHYYGKQAATNDNATVDPQRDASNWQLISKIVQHNVPTLAICRGFQEINAFFGGTLHHRVHEVEGLNDHREDTSAPVEQQYAPAHLVDIHSGGLLASMFCETQIKVNSIHMQGIEHLGEPLTIEATAPDGLIEAISHPKLAFLLAVQWHPEWQPKNYPQNATVINGFIDACHQHKRNGR